MKYRLRRNKNRYTVPVLLAVAGVVLVVGSVFIVSQYSTTPTKKTLTKQKTISYQLANNPEEAIAHGTGWFTSNLSQTQPFQRLVLDYVQRRFGLERKLSAEVSPIVAPATEPDKSEYATIRRIAEPTKFVSSLPTKTDALNQQIMAAANCDHIALPLNYDDQLVANIQAGGYELTHVILMLDFMTDNGCPLPPKTLALRPTAYQTMAAIAGDAAQKPDLRYEAMAFLLHDHQQALVKADWIQWIVSSQRRDGGWNVTGDAKEVSGDHPTLLALWALLEYSRPNTPDQPMIHRPNL